MTGAPIHATLVADTVTTITFDADLDTVEVLNLTGTAEVWFKFGGAAPTVGGAGCHVLPAAIGAVDVRPKTTGVTVLKLISSGTPKVSARGLD